MLILPLLLPTASALYFYQLTSEQKCFVQELPQHTMVLGQYKLEQSTQGVWKENNELGIEILVTQEPERHVVKDQWGASSGRFSFTASESAVYHICLNTNSSGWFTDEKARIHFDLTYSEDSELYAPEEDPADQKLSDMVRRVRDLNHRISEIRREQQFQKQREAQFRDTSESTNSRVIRWSILQIVLLAVTAWWQVRHLKGFFTEKKMV